MDFSICDVIRVGFERDVFIIRKADENAIKNMIGNRIEKVLDVSYVFQDIRNIPNGLEISEEKNWGEQYMKFRAPSPIYIIAMEKMVLKNIWISNKVPSVVSGLLEENKALVNVLSTDDMWYGVTY